MDANTVMVILAALLFGLLATQSVCQAVVDWRRAGNPCRCDDDPDGTDEFQPPAAA